MAAFDKTNPDLPDDEEDHSDDNIWIASSNGDIERVKELLQSGISINAQDEYGYSPIHAAVSYGEIDLIHFLVEHGADLELRDHDGDTPLLVSESPEVYELLIQLGANPSARNHNNEGIIEKILEDSNLTMMQYFVEKGQLDENTVFQKFELTEEEMMEGIDEGEEEEDGNDDDDNNENMEEQ